MAPSARHEGVLPSGSPYLIEIPEDWNGVLLSLQRPHPAEPDEPVWTEEESLPAALVARGFALAASGNKIFWPLENAFSDQEPLLDTFAHLAGEPKHTIPIGLSIGGIMTAGLVQRFPERFSGALPLCGNLAGAVGTHNRELDIAFVVKTLLAPDTGLELVNISDPGPNFRVSQSVLADAQATAGGRARLSLAAAVGNIPGWRSPGSPEPAPHDARARQQNQFGWFEDPCFVVYFWAREQVERQAGGNPSWNTGVDYRDLLARSPERETVEALYAEAGIDLDADLQTLADADRFEADQDAVAYLERHIVFDGNLGKVPVLVAHTIGDGLVTPDHVRAYTDVVAARGHADLLRSVFINRGGHCTFSIAEVVAALEALLARVESGAWDDLRPKRMNERAAELGLEAAATPFGTGGGPAFRAFEPPRFPRPYDAHTAAGSA